LTKETPESLASTTLNKVSFLLEEHAIKSGNKKKERYLHMARNSEDETTFELKTNIKLNLKNLSGEKLRPIN
jgi:hypothetical protein